MKIQIKSRWRGNILFEVEAGSVKAALQIAVKYRADLSRANLYGANLSGADLSRARLSRADLSGADLSGADLYGANLYGANLSGADLSRARLSRANLYGADLSGANLYGANLYGANLSRARLYGADLSGAKISEDATLQGIRPFLTLGPIGSRQDYLQAFVTNQGILIRTGCFLGTLKEFTDQVEATHKDNQHAQEYTAAVVLIQEHAKQWPAK